MRQNPRRGFTLIELLVVLGIIALLIAITLVVGNQVVQGSRVRLTQDTIRILDSALAAYESAKEENPPAWEYLSDLDPTQSAAAAKKRFPAADARDMNTNQMINSVGVFYWQASKVPSAKAILDTLPSKVVHAEDLDGNGVQPKLVTVFDGWGHPIRYVHPVFQGVITDSVTTPSPNDATGRSIIEVLGQPDNTTPATTDSIALIRRNNHPAAGFNQSTSPPQAFPDSDGGVAIGTRPYFYSAGADGLVGLQSVGGTSFTDFNKDNVYTVQPKLPTK